MVSRSQSKVCFFFDDISITLSQRTLLKAFIETIFQKEKKKLDSLNYIFCRDRRLLDINREWLNHDNYTDIITFGLSEPGSPIQGEIYISVERVRENAKNLGIPFKTELLRVMFHGSLHLCGYNDKTSTDKTEMRAAEDKCLRRYKTFHVEH